MNQRIILTYIVLLAFLGLIAFTYITRSTNLAYNQYQVEDFDDRVKQVIRSNPKLIVDSVMQWQKEESEAEKGRLQKNASAVYKDMIADGALPRIGSGEIKVIEFYDYMCGYCKAMGKIKEKYMNEGVEFIIIANPVLGKESAYLANATEVMRELSPQNFAAIHLDILSSPRGVGVQALIDGILTKYNINKAEFNDLINSEQIAKQVHHGITYAEIAGVYATPAYIIDGQLHMGALSEQKFAKLIKR